MSVCPNCHQPILSDDIYCDSCGSKLSSRAIVAPPARAAMLGGGMVSCPACGHVNEPDSLFCEQDGTRLQQGGATGAVPVTEQQLSGVLVMPDHSEIQLSHASRVFGRSDFMRQLKPENVKEVSRVHFTITQEAGAYYVQDGGPDPNNPNGWKPSINRTILNGVSLDAGEKRRLSDKDVIDVASLGLNMTFKTK